MPKFGIRSRNGLIKQALRHNTNPYGSEGQNFS